MTTLHKAVFKIHIAAPVERVWAELTREGQPLSFFYGSVQHLPDKTPGGPWRMRTPDGKFTACVGEVVAMDEPRLFAHTFRFTQFDEAPCKVTYELTPARGGTDLVMLLDDLPAGTKTEKYMTGGGTYITTTLKALIEEGRPSWKTRLFLRMIGALSFLTPKRCRSEHWPLDRAIR